jgi:hypothetical protein
MTRPAVVAVGHDQTADEARGDAPRRRPRQRPLLVLIDELDLVGLGEVLAEVVRGAGLQGLAVTHEGLDGVSAGGARELLGVALRAEVHGHGQNVLGHLAVHLEDVERLLLRFFGGGVKGVAFLPEELGGAQEGAGHLLPAHHVAPLVEKNREITPRLHPLGVHRADHGFRGRTDGERLLELFPAADGHPGALGREALDVFFLLLQEALGNEQGEVGVLVTKGLDAAVGFRLQVFPDGEAVGADDHAALDRTVVREFGLQHDVQVPLREIHRRWRDFLERAFFH